MRLLADLKEGTVDTRMFKLQEIKLKQVDTALERFQEDKSFGTLALRRVLGAQFLRQGDEDDEALFMDQDEIDEEDIEHDNSAEDVEVVDEDDED